MIHRYAPNPRPYLAPNCALKAQQAQRAEERCMRYQLYLGRAYIEFIAASLFNMPGGLAAWLHDDHSMEHAHGGTASNQTPSSTLCTQASGSSTPPPFSTREPLTPARGYGDHEVIDVKETSLQSCRPHSEGGRACNDGVESLPDINSNTNNDSSTNWDPFEFSHDARGEAKSDAFARLVQGASAKLSTRGGGGGGGGVVHAGNSATYTTPARKCDLRNMPGSNTTTVVSDWDPFASGGKGKENRRNAFSSMMEATGRGNSVGGTPVNSKGVASARKRKRPMGFSKGEAGGGRDTGSTGASTRFCECPVCGKRVRCRQVYTSYLGLHLLLLLSLLMLLVSRRNFRRRRCVDCRDYRQP